MIIRNIINTTLNIPLLIPSHARARSLFISIIHDTYHNIDYLLKRKSHDYKKQNNIKNENSEGLIVYIHGLVSDPVIGKSLYAQEIEKREPGKYTILVPNVPKKGNCSLEEAATPILEIVRKYIKENPGKPVQLIGHSNGGRIAGYIETHTRDLDVNMRVTGIAGVFEGTNIVNIGNIFNLTNVFISPVLANELKTNSKVSKKLINDMRQKVENGSRKYTFYTTVDDLAIPNYTSCLPKINQKEEYIIKTGCSHSSIQRAINKEEIEKVLKFMKTFSPSQILL